jgi:multidrug resistance efflux pump
VRKGDLLVRLDDTAIRDSLASAEESVHGRPARAFEQAERQLQRLKTLQAARHELDRRRWRIRRDAAQQCPE